MVSVNSKLKPKDKNRSQNGPKTSGVNPVSVYDLNAGWPNEGYTPQHFGAILSIQRNPQVTPAFGLGFVLGLRSGLRSGVRVKVRVRVRVKVRGQG